MKSTLSQHFEDYIRYCTHTKMLRRATIEGYENVFRLFVSLMPELTYIDDVSTDAIDAFFERLRTRKRVIGRGTQKTGVKNSTIRGYGSRLHAFFDWLCTRGRLEKNPIDRTQLAKPVYSDKRALERQEIEKIISAISQQYTNRFLLKRNLAIVQVLLFVGLRKTELISLRVSDVDLHTQTLMVRGETSKSRKSRHMPLTIETTTAIEDYLQERRARGLKSEFLWTSHSKDSPLTEGGILHLVKSLKNKSGVNFHLHRFRHTYACMLGRNNVSAIKIQKLLGHTDLRMTQAYLRSLGVEDVRDSVQFLTLENLPGV